MDEEELENQLIKRVYTTNNENEDIIENSEEELTIAQKDETKIPTKKNKTKNNQTRYKRLASKNINQNGHLYIELLLEAYDEELINDLDLSNELGVPHTVIPYVINKLNGGRR